MTLVNSARSSLNSRYGFGGWAPGVWAGGLPDGGAPGGAPPGRSSSGTASMSVSVKASGWLASGAIGEKYFLAALGRLKLGRLLPAGRATSRSFFGRRNESRIQTIAAEGSRKAAEICASEENGEAINGDQPNRKRLKPDPRFAFFPLNGSMDLLHVIALAVIHSLTSAPFGVHLEAA